MNFREIESVVFDFDGVFTDNTVIVDQNGIESVRCWRSDGLGLDRLRSLGIKLLIISTEVNPVVTTRAKKLKMECMQGINDKSAAILEWASANKISLSKTAFVGNDINDIVAFNEVGFPIAVADCYYEVRPHVRFVLSRMGGYGAVRELCDLIYDDYNLSATAAGA
jgi:3-deoxy-D-manno-octulosonate 8-phosphate phosphatase (KDO 8-P phosphatase)